jgi:hypothetical protein
VWGGVECVEAAETFLERDMSVDSEAVETFCRFRGGAIQGWGWFLRCLDVVDVWADFAA